MMNLVNNFSKLFPRCLTTGLYLWSLYAIVVCIHVIRARVVLPLVFAIAMVALYTYAKLIYVGPGTTKEYSILRVYDLNAAESGFELPPEMLVKRSYTQKRNGRFRVCKSCSSWKPDRCHHCSTCNVCVLKMDHHCPWFAGCVGYRNQKFFIQFLIYCTVYSILVLILSSMEIYTWFKGEFFEVELINFTLLSLWLLALVVSISITIFTVFSISQVCQNQTTIELYSLRRYNEEVAFLNEFSNEPIKGTINIFDLGKKLINWEEVMGYSLIEWALPISRRPSSLDLEGSHSHGLFFNVNKNVSKTMNESVDLQDRLLRRLTPRSSLDVDRSNFV